MSDFYLKIRYRGQLEQPNDVFQLIKETEDICRTNGWSYRVWEEDWIAPQTLTMEFRDGAMNFEGHAPLKGISFSIGESETIWLTFTPDGLLQSLMTLVQSDFFLDDDKFPWQRVKTGFDGAKSHIALCKLFRYLEGKYFDVFEVLDESGYWKEGNDAKFTKWMNGYLHDSQLLEEELAALDEDASLNKEQKYEMSMRLIKEHGEKYRRRG